MNPFDNAPDELKQLKRWMLWNKNSDGRKIPIQLGGHSGSSTDSKCWCAFEIAVESAIYYQGIAFVIDEPYTGIDLDNCFDENGLRPWAIPIVCKLDGVSYAEVSPSGNGIKFTTRARKKIARCVKKFGPNKQQMEVYDHARFWTITGDVYAGNRDILDGQSVVDWICDTYLGDGEEEKTGTVKHEPAPIRTNFSSLMDRAIAYLASVGPESKGNLRNGAFKLSGHLHSLVDEFGGRLTDSEVQNLLCDWNQKNADQLKSEEIKEAAVNGRKNGTPRADKVPFVMQTELIKQVDLSLMTVAKSKPSISKKMPNEFLDIPGLIGDIVRLNLDCSFYPLPELAIGGALALMAAITGGKVVDEFRNRTNLYVVGVALAGAGKDISRKLNRMILRSAGGADIVGPERIGSHAGMISALAVNWNTLFQIDEIGRLFATTKDAGKSPHLYNIESVLLSLWSSADDIWTADAYADRAKVKQLEYPHCCVYGSSVPDEFWGALTEKSLTGGLLARFMIFDAPEYVSYQRGKDLQIPESIVERAAWWLALQTASPSGNLSPQVGGSSPLKIMYDKAADDRMQGHLIEIGERRKQEDRVTAAIWSRVGEKTQKLALLFACSRCEIGYKPVIQLCDVDLAIRMSNWLTRKMLSQSSKRVARTQHEKETLDILRLFDDQPEWGHRELMRKTRNLKPRERGEIISYLIECEEIERFEVETGGRRAIMYRKV